MEYEKILQKNGYKITETRKLLLSFLSKKHEPMTAQRIHTKSKIGDLASIYRSLKLFVALGICYEERQGGTESLYGITKHKHHHIICRMCKHTDCVPCTHTLPTIKHFSNITHAFSLSGICQQCQS